MLMIWRRHGWLVLVYFLLAWGLAQGLITQAYQQATGDPALYNSEKAITWGIALIAMSVVMFGLNLLLLRNEGKQTTDEEWQAHKDSLLAKYRYYPLIDDAPDAAAKHRAQFEAALLAAPVPQPTKASHFFFIPMKFMPIIFVVVAVLLLVVNIPVAQAGN